MEKILIPVFLLLLIGCTTSQTDPSDEKRPGEFMVYDNGLIYDRPTMLKLGKTVDSLNLRFKSCEPSSYYSLEQGYGTYILITKNVQRAREAIRQNVKLEDFLRAFPATELKKNVWIVKEHINYYREPTIQYHSEGADFLDIDVPDTRQYNKADGWIYEAHSDEIEIFYLHGLRSSVIPVEYARLIQYVDCMVDTTATIFPKEEKPDSLTYILAAGSKVKEFVDLAMDFETEPKKPVINIDDPDKADVYRQFCSQIDERRNWKLYCRLLEEIFECRQPLALGPFQSIR